MTKPIDLQQQWEHRCKFCFSTYPPGGIGCCHDGYLAAKKDDPPAKVPLSAVKDAMFCSSDDWQICPLNPDRGLTKV